MTNSSSERPGEFDLIAELFAPLATHPGAFGLTDDAAVLTPPAGHELVLKTDAIVEGVHFLPGDPADTVAKKALRVNLSDLAAKGAAPIGYMLALSIPSRVGMDWLHGFAFGLREDQGTFGISLFGGDTTSTPGPISIAISAFGHVPAGSMLRRAGAQPGDLAFVSGTIGDAGGGLACLKGEGSSLEESEREFLIRRFRVPEPRLALGAALRGTASASLDVSDGLMADLGHIADVSRVRIVVESVRLPLSPALLALKGADAASIAAAAGDDYEIAFTAPPFQRARIAEIAARSGVQVTEIGRVETGAGVTLTDPSGRKIPLTHKGFTHF